MMVIEQEAKEALLGAFADYYMRKILLSTVPRAKSILEISDDTGIPISTCYRRVRDLLNFRLLGIERTVLSNGRKYETFRSRVKDATVNLSSDEISVDVTLMPREPEKRLSEILGTLRRKEMEVLPTVR
jgi:hypothetical protein